VIVRILHILSLVVLVGSAVAVYKVKYETTYEAQRIAKLRNEIRTERERLGLLRAEWSRLSAPQRIQDLASRHLGMKPLEVARISDLSALPEKPPTKESDDLIGEFIERISGGAPRDPLGEFLRSINDEGSKMPAGASR
jgi:cell division protein FtsL